MMQLVYASASLQLQLCPAQELLYLDWQPGVSSEGFRQGLTAAVLTTRGQRLRGWITQNQHVYPLAPAEQLWLLEHGLLALHHSTLQCVAVVVPADAFQECAPESLIRSTRSLVSYAIDYFPTLADAESWVHAGPAHKTQPRTPTWDSRSY
ncbi:hypothetical protein [Hymenobacter sp. GOD-10R]|uniref:hypothetical protein n=1 Tax=Hymenobacter sp. GOD-10R TaxID=3093922 RepID=UPI002D77CEC6|nr:hypothetical protein [Hymenobacter sp. GOD-10R]WRQ31646.1 hypothetical protein SD425_27830 [Hymenobacter sp. GOD-10R]